MSGTFSRRARVLVAASAMAVTSTFTVASTSASAQVIPPVSSFVCPILFALADNAPPFLAPFFQSLLQAAGCLDGPSGNFTD